MTDISKSRRPHELGSTSSTEVVGERSALVDRDLGSKAVSRTLTGRIPDEHHAALELIAFVEGKKLSDVIRDMVDGFLSQIDFESMQGQLDESFARHEPTLERMKALFPPTVEG